MCKFSEIGEIYCFRSNSSGSSVNSPSALGGSVGGSGGIGVGSGGGGGGVVTGLSSTGSMANPYAMGPLYHSPGVQSYCAPTDNLSLAGHYTDMRSSAGWYGSTANDPRFASKYFDFFLYFKFQLVIFSFLSYFKLKSL